MANKTVKIAFTMFLLMGMQSCHLWKSSPELIYQKDGDKVILSISKSKSFWLEKIVFENHKEGSPYYVLEPMDNKKLVKIDLQNPNLEILKVKGNINEACKQENLIMSVWAIDDKLNKEYFSIYYPCEFDTLINIQSEKQPFP